MSGERKVVVINKRDLDGVMQAPGPPPDEEPPGRLQKPMAGLGDAR